MAYTSTQRRMVRPSTPVLAITCLWLVLSMAGVPVLAQDSTASSAVSTGAVAATVGPGTRQTVGPATNSHASHYLRLALYKGPGTDGPGLGNLMRHLNRDGESSLDPILPNQIRAGELTNFQVVIFAGGSASKQAEALQEEGRKAVQEFVQGGGGYIGICAGAYLATSGFSWGLNLVNAKTVSPKWMRGRGTVKIELTDYGHGILGNNTNLLDILYVNGPIVNAAEHASLPPMRTLAWFRTELAENGTPVGVMVNSPAIFAGQYHAGRVFCSSPHPEQTKGLEEFIPQAANWVATRSVGVEANGR